MTPPPPAFPGCRPATVGCAAERQLVTARESASPPPGRRCHREELLCRLRCLMRCFSPGSTGPPRLTPCACSNAGGKIADQFTIEHSADGIACADPPAGPATGEPGGMPVAIERPNGRLVDLLLEAGHPVVPVKPNAIKTWRDGEVLLGCQIRRRGRRRDRRVPAAARAQAAGRRPLLRRDERAAHRRAHPRGPGGDAGRGH